LWLRSSSDETPRAAPLQDGSWRDPDMLKAEVDMLRASAARQLEIISELKVENDKLKAEVERLKALVPPAGAATTRPSPAVKPKEEGPPQLTRAVLMAYVEANLGDGSTDASRRANSENIKPRVVLIKGRVISVTTRRLGKAKLVTESSMAGAVIKSAFWKGQPETVYIRLEAEFKAEQVAHLKAGQVVTVYGALAEIRAKRGYQQRPHVDIRLDGAELK